MLVTIKVDVMCRTCQCQHFLARGMGQLCVKGLGVFRPRPEVALAADHERGYSNKRRVPQPLAERLIEAVFQGAGRRANFVATSTPAG